MAISKLGAKIALDGEKEFRNAIKNINSEAKVLASEMKKVTAEFDSNDKSTKALTERGKVLEKQQQTQASKVEELRRALENAKKEYPDNVTKINAWETSLNNAEADLIKLTKQVDKNSDELEQSKKPLGDVSKGFKDMGDGADTSAKKSNVFGQALLGALTGGAILGAINGIVNGLKSIASGLVEIVKEAGEYADEIVTLSQVTGIATDELEAYTFAADFLDVSLETLTGSMSRTVKSMTSAKNGSQDLQGVFKTLNVEFQNTDGTLRDSREVYWELLESLQGVANETERDSLAMQLFGKSAQDLNPLILAGKDSFDELSEAAKESGYILGTETLNDLLAFDDGMNKLDLSVKAAKRQLASALAPALLELSEILLPIVQEVTDFIKNNRAQIIKFLNDFVVKIKEQIELWKGNDTAVQKLKKSFEDFKKGIEAIQPILKGLGVVFKLLIDGINVYMKIVEENVYTLLVFGQSIVTFFANAGTDIKNFFTNAFNSVKATINGIVSFFQSIPSTLGGIFTNIGNGAISTFKNVVSTITSAFSTVVSEIRTATSPIISIFTSVWSGIKGVFSNVGSFFGDTFSNAWQKVKDVFSAGGEIFAGIKEGIASAFKTTVNSLISGINAVVSIPFDNINNALSTIRNAKILGVQPFKGLGSIAIPQIPKLATGTVVPANFGDFAAILGDNKREPEIVSPLSTMKRAMSEVLGSTGNVTLQIVMDKRVIGEAIYPTIDSLFVKNRRVRTVI